MRHHARPGPRFARLARLPPSPPFGDIAIMIRTIAAAACALATTLPAGFAWSQDAFPSRPIRVIVPYAAGGVVDVQTRAATQRMATELGQPIVVEAKPGASGSIAAEYVARAPADGYTLLVSAPFLVTAPLLEDKLRWKPQDFAAVGRFSLSPSYLVVSAKSSAKSVKDVVAMARRASPPMQYGDGGTGTTQTMATELLRASTGVKMEAVAYKGAPPMVPDLINGSFAFAVLPSSVAYPHVQSGAIRALANMSDRRSPRLPDVPTIAEAGFPQATALSWYGLHAPAGTPPQVIARLSDALRRSTDAADTKERMANAGGEEAYLDHAAFDAFVKEDAKHWTDAVNLIRR